MMPSARLWTYERGLLGAVELNALPPRVEAHIRASVSEIGVEAVESLAQASGEDAAALASRFESGRRCFAARVDSEAEDARKLVAYGWVSQRSEYIGEQERSIKLAADEAYIWDCATLPEYRGKRLYSALLSHILGSLAQEKVRRVWIGAATKNRASVQGYLNAGFQPVITVTYARIARLSMLWIGAQAEASRELVDAARKAWLEPDEKVWGSLAWRWAPP